MATSLERFELELFGLLADARVTNSLAVAGLTIVVIEHIANFKDEVLLLASCVEIRQVKHRLTWYGKSV
ncbi:hypothetical protein B0H14DRAFT_3430598 [Mycena olivaceomarginata]|nr:hypothetical protein B0H14DRAFT_3430598 [Mycena olivaceomarginata]